jgi:hypothetical protein
VRRGRAGRGRGYGRAGAGGVQGRGGRGGRARTHLGPRRGLGRKIWPVRGRAAPYMPPRRPVNAGPRTAGARCREGRLPNGEALGRQGRRFGRAARSARHAAVQAARAVGGRQRAPRARGRRSRPVGPGRAPGPRTHPLRSQDCLDGAAGTAAREGAAMPLPPLPPPRAPPLTTFDRPPRRATLLSRARATIKPTAPLSAPSRWKRFRA